MCSQYILEGKTPVVCYDSIKWSDWFKNNIKIAETKIDNVGVSTIFLGLDHNHSGYGPPILFETMIFGGKFDQECERYSTYEEAEKGHQAMVELVKNESK